MSGYEPGQVLKWIISETAKFQEESSLNPINENEELKATNPTQAEDDVQVESLRDLPPDEREKWMNVILGNNTDVINNRTLLKTTIDSLLTTIYDSDKKRAQPQPIVSTKERQEEELVKKYDSIMNSLEVIHHLQDKNEAVIYQTGGLALLLYLVSGNYLLIQNDPYDTRNVLIQTLCAWIIQDLAQNNPSVQSQMYHLRGMYLLIAGLKRMYSEELLPDKVSKEMELLRIKLWGAIYSCCQLHNPNLNVFLMEQGYLYLNQSLMDTHANTLTQNKLKEVFRICRFISYLLGSWTDANVDTMTILKIFPCIHHTVQLLGHDILPSLYSDEKEPSVSINASEVPYLNELKKQSKQVILDILRDLCNAISEFMKRNGKCRRFVIISNETLVESLQTLHEFSLKHIHTNFPKLTKSKKYRNEKLLLTRVEKLYPQQSHSPKSSAHGKKKGQKSLSKDESAENIPGIISDEMYAMIDIIDCVASITRQVKRYEVTRDQSMKFAKWKDRQKYKKKQKQRLQKKKAIENSKRKRKMSTESKSDTSDVIANFETRDLVLYRPSANDTSSQNTQQNPKIKKD